MKHLPSVESKIDLKAFYMKAVAHRFGEITFDLAASDRKSSAGPRCYLGMDAFGAEWSKTLTAEKLLWASPPFSDIAAWCTKILAERKRGCPPVLAFFPAYFATWFFRGVWVPLFRGYCDVYINRRHTPMEMATNSYIQSILVHYRHPAPLKAAGPGSVSLWDFRSDECYTLKGSTHEGLHVKT